MNKLLSAVFGGLTLLRMASASAQGLPPGYTPPQYGSQAWSVNRQPSHDPIVRMADRHPAAQAAVPGKPSHAVEHLSQIPEPGNSPGKALITRRQQR